MAEKSGARNRFEEDEIVAALVPDPSRVPLLRLVRGYPGRAVADDVRRIYLTADMSRYIEVPEEHVHLVRPIPHGEGSNIWIHHDAPVVSVDIRLSRAGESYLYGPVSECAPPQPSPTSTCNPIWPTSKPTTWGAPIEEGGTEPTKCTICHTRFG